MFRRTIRLAAVAGAVVGVPYVASEWPKLKANVNELVAKSPFGGSTAARPVSTSSSSPLIVSNDPRVIGAQPVSDEPPLVEMSEIFRFEVTPNWVLARWPRVSAGISDDTLHGMRVAWISGMRPDDVAGSLTYYFTPTQKCTKITFSGATGDPRRLTELLVHRFGFKPVASTEPGALRYEIHWNDQALSELTIHTAGVVRTATPLARYQVQVILRKEPEGS